MTNLELFDLLLKMSKLTLFVLQLGLKLTRFKVFSLGREMEGQRRNVLLTISLNK